MEKKEKMGRAMRVLSRGGIWGGWRRKEGRVGRGRRREDRKKKEKKKKEEKKEERMEKKGILCSDIGRNESTSI